MLPNSSGNIFEGREDMRRDINALRGDVRMLVVAVDGHNERLDDINTRVERIESRINLADAE
jgi:hypothetical protein